MLALTGGTAVVFSHAALAQSVQVQGAWARATVPGQMASGAFMRLTAPTDMRLKSVTTPVAGVAEVHEMRLDGDVMKMKALPNGLELPAGKTVELKPGGYHIMLMDLKQPLKKDSDIALTLVFVDSRGVQSTTELKLPVALMPPMVPVAPMGQ
jgi:copper(I)-binding protein